MLNVLNPRHDDLCRSVVGLGLRTHGFLWYRLRPLAFRSWYSLAFLLHLIEFGGRFYCVTEGLVYIITAKPVVRKTHPNVFISEQQIIQPRWRTFNCDGEEAVLIKWEVFHNSEFRTFDVETQEINDRRCMV